MQNVLRKKLEIGRRKPLINVSYGIIALNNFMPATVLWTDVGE